MTDDVIDVALQGATAALDVQERIWLIGVARLVDIPEHREVGAEEVTRILDMARQVTIFPSGPVGFVRDGFDQEVTDSYRLVVLTADSAPHLEMQIGLGIAGFVAVALTRSGVFEDTGIDPSGVLLSDMESVIADTFTLAAATAVQFGYLGLIDMTFAVSDEGPGRAPTFLRVDDEDGRLVPIATLEGPLRPLRYQLVLSAESTAESVHQDLYAAARHFAASVGATDAEFVRSTAADLDVFDEDPLQVARRRVERSADSDSDSDRG